MRSHVRSVLSSLLAVPLLLLAIANPLPALDRAAPDREAPTVMAPAPAVDVGLVADVSDAGPTVTAFDRIESRHHIDALVQKARGTELRLATMRSETDSLRARMRALREPPRRRLLGLVASRHTNTTDRARSGPLIYPRLA